MGVGVGRSAEEYAALGQDFGTRGRRCEEQIRLLRMLWTQDAVEFAGRWDQIAGIGIRPLPVQQPIPIWIGPGGGGGVIAETVLRRIGYFADGWFAIIPPGDVGAANIKIHAAAEEAGRDPSAIGIEGAVAIGGKSAGEWIDEIESWRESGATHICMRTLGAGLDTSGHLTAMREIKAIMDRELS